MSTASRQLLQVEGCRLVRPAGASSTPLSIVHIAAPASVGGLERVVQGLAIGHHHQDHRVCVIAVVDPDTDEHSFIDSLLEAGVHVEVLRIPPRAYIRERRLVADLLRRIRPHVVHTHGYRPDLLHAGVARSARIPLVTTVHGSSRMGGATHFYEWLVERSLWRFHAVVAVSNPIAESLRSIGITEPRLQVVPNAWTPGPPMLDRATARKELGLDAETFVVGWVGRLIRAKGCDVFLEALARLPDLPIQVAIIGDGGERAQLEAQAAALGVAGRIRFYGMVERAETVFSAFDLYALSSRTEGTPIVLLEAMAAGVPIVATRVGGVPDVISPLEALLVPSQDPDALAGAIQEVSESPRVAVDRAERAQHRVREEHGGEGWLSHYEAIYRAISHVA